MAGDKIRDDEILSDEELDNVAGGGVLQTGYDMQRAIKLGLFDFDSDKLNNTWAFIRFFNEHRGELPDMFAKFGIQFTQRPDEGGNFRTNEYIYNGQKISQDEAWDIIEQQLGK